MSHRKTSSFHVQNYGPSIFTTRLVKTDPSIVYGRKTDMASTGTTMLSAALGYMVAKGIATPKTYLADIEFGVEPISGSGKVTLTNYNVQ